MRTRNYDQCFTISAKESDKLMDIIYRFVILHRRYQYSSNLLSTQSFDNVTQSNRFVFNLLKSDQI